MRCLAYLVLTVLWCVPALAATSSIVNSAHNLSASGPGAIRASSEQQICIFCHTPHNAAPVQPLWNRRTPPNAYRPYSSNSMQALPGQPTGSSKLCLSCHDGTIALGNVVSRSQSIPMAGGMMTIPPGKSNLGTDLSDDHPISFRYDATLAAKDNKLKDPKTLPDSVRLDFNSELQCTTCHDPHDNTFGKFLAIDNSASQLCNTCHQPGATTVTGHQQCSGCHQTHTAPSGPYLLKAAKVAQTCTNCHQSDGAAKTDIAADLQKTSVHDTYPVVNLQTHVPDNVTCTNCHGPHTMKSGVAVAPQIPGHFGEVPGVNAAGSPVAIAQYEYEVCFQCHADKETVQPTIPRVATQANKRLQFASTAISAHPVVAPGRETSVPSLVPGMTNSTMIYCSDCHSSDTSRKSGAGSGANGPHGSNNTPLLIAGYQTTDRTSESATAYALCYRCHDRNSILADESFPLHRKHIVERNTPCSMCHDAHGISSLQGNSTNSTHLINFDTRYVTKNTGLNPYFKDTGVRSGSCNLTCHNKPHTETMSYPSN